VARRRTAVAIDMFGKCWVGSEATDIGGMRSMRPAVQVPRRSTAFELEASG